MGDRSNIVVQQANGDRVFLYGHWMGTDAIAIAHKVLSRNQRWDDTSYLTRMLFSEMVRGDLDSDTGFGISTSLCDNEYPIIVIDPSEQMVWLEDYNWADGKFVELTPKARFDMFINACSVSQNYDDLLVAMGSALVK